MDTKLRVSSLNRTYDSGRDMPKHVCDLSGRFQMQVRLNQLKRCHSDFGHSGSGHLIISVGPRKLPNGVNDAECDQQTQEGNDVPDVYGLVQSVCNYRALGVTISQSLSSHEEFR